MSDDIDKYNAWRITFQDAEKAAQAAFADGLACRREIAALRTIISDIKEWDVDQLITLPLALRKRMQAVLDNAEQTGQ